LTDKYSREGLSDFESGYLEALGDMRVNFIKKMNKKLQNFRSKYFCKHKFSDYTYYGCKHPKCDKCGYEDESRILDNLKQFSKKKWEKIARVCCFYMYLKNNFIKNE